MCWYVVVVCILETKWENEVQHVDMRMHPKLNKNEKWQQYTEAKHLDGRSQPRKPHAVIWMTRLHRVNGHRSAELFLFLTVVVNGHVLIALFLSLLLSYGEFLFLKLGRRYLSSRDVRSTSRALTWRR